MLVDVREQLVALLRECGVMTLIELGIEQQVSNGQLDIDLGDLRMDSLAAMEFCIALESTWGLSISPQDLAHSGSLGHLADRLGSS